MQRKGIGDAPGGDVDTAMSSSAQLQASEPLRVIYLGNSADIIARVSALLAAAQSPISLVPVSSADGIPRFEGEGSILAAFIEPSDNDQRSQLLVEQVKASNPWLPLVILSRNAERGCACAASVGAECFVLNGDSTGSGLATALRCASARQYRETRVLASAHRDPVTGFASSALFNDRLHHGLIRAQRTAESLAVMVVDIESDSGADVDAGSCSDGMVRAVGERINRFVREGDTVARLASERFGIVMEGMRSERKSLAVAEKILQSVLKPVTIGKQKVSAGAVIGVAVFPDHAGEAKELIERAGAAAEQARRTGGNRCCLHAFGSPTHEREVAQDIDLAANDHQFRVFYQPYVDIDSGKIAGVEALLRWKHPERGVLSPQEFLTQSERSGLINQIGRWILLTACRQMRQWGQEGLLSVPMSVNVSTRQLLTPGFQGMVESVLRETGLDPRMLVLEIPPDLQHREAIACATPLRALRELGVRLALDDFGGEGRALASVHDIPADIWKIDELFIHRSAQDDVNSAILSALVELGRRLDVEIIAKGVESGEQLENLRMHGVDAAQGIALCAPLPATNLHKWVQSLQAA